MAATGADFGVLGPLQMCIDGAPVPLGTPKQRAVFAMLLINRNRTVATDALIDAAWEQFPPPDPRTSLHSYVSNLRKLLAKVDLDSRTALASAPPGYRLIVPESNCDIGRFVAAKNAGAQRQRRVNSNRPADGCRRRWRNGGGRCWRTCATFDSSAASPPP